MSINHIVANWQNDPIFTFKAYMIFDNVSSELIYNLSCDLNIRRKWDPVYYIVQDVEHISTDKKNENDITTADIIYTCLHTPPTISKRDSCLLRLRKQITDPNTKRKTYISFMKTVSHPKCPLKKEFVRAKTNFHGYIIEQLDNNQCKLFVMSQHGTCSYV